LGAWVITYCLKCTQASTAACIGSAMPSSGRTRDYTQWRQQQWQQQQSGRVGAERQFRQTCTQPCSKGKT
jgi:hypothetical protein